MTMPSCKLGDLKTFHSRTFGLNLQLLSRGSAHIPGGVSFLASSGLKLLQ